MTQKIKLLHENAYELISTPPSDVENVNTSNFQKNFTKLNLIKVF